ncbi:MAG: hypothetical protein ACI936_001535 [Paraglaciecola sp.]
MHNRFLKVITNTQLNFKGELQVETGKSEGNYTLAQMQQSATIAQTADGLEISGNNFKVTSLTACPDMVLFACERIEELKQELMQTQRVVTEIQNLSSEVSCFVENLHIGIVGRNSAFNTSLEIGSKIRNLDLPEFTVK